MPFDGLAIRALCRELTAELDNARIDKIHQPEKDELSWSLRTPKAGNIKLLISANPRWARMHLSNAKKVNPPRPSSFCMLLRKYLEGGKIREVKQVGLERIVHIRIEALDDFREWREKLLICEFTGRHSNIILLNPDTGIIIDAIKRYDHELSSYREVLPGKNYVSPPAQDKLDPVATGFSEFVARIWKQPGDTTVASAFFNIYMGISPYTARQICSMAGVDKDLPVEQCGEYELSRLFYATRSLIESIEQVAATPTIQYKHQRPVEITPYYPSFFDEQIQTQEFTNMNQACDVYYEQKLNLIRMESMKANLARQLKEHLDKAYKKRFLQEGDLQQARDKDKYKLWGELLTAYAHLYQKGDREAVLNDFYTGEEIRFPLDPRYTPIQNAQKFFKIYTKSQGARKHLQRLMKKNQVEIDYLESVLVAVRQADRLFEINEIIGEMERGGYLKSHLGRVKTPEQKSQPRKYVSKDGLEILVGRNNRQNDWLTLKFSDRHDLWLHTQKIPGTHVIVRLPVTFKSINDIPEATLLEAAALAAYYSQGSESTKVPVDYTFRSNVKKPTGAKPGMVIYDNYWTVMVDPTAALLVEQADSTPSLKEAD